MTTNPHPTGTLKYWAAEYDVAFKTIARWKEAFRERIGIEAPLEDPAEMVKRWPEVFDEKPPWKVVARVGKFGTKSPVVETMRAEAKQPPTPKPEPPAQDFNFNDSVLIAERNLVACAKILEIAIATNDPVEIKNAQPAYKDAAETLRKTKLASAKISKDDGDSFDAQTVRNEIHRIHATIPKTIRTRLKDDLSAFLRSNVVPTVDQMRTAVDVAIDSAFAHLASVSFLGGDE